MPHRVLALRCIIDEHDVQEVVHACMGYIYLGSYIIKWNPYITEVDTTGNFCDSYSITQSSIYVINTGIYICL